METAVGAGSGRTAQMVRTEAKTILVVMELIAAMGPMPGTEVTAVRAWGAPCTTRRLSPW